MAESHTPDSNLNVVDDDDSILINPDKSDYQFIQTPQFDHDDPSVTTTTTTTPTTKTHTTTHTHTHKQFHTTKKPQKLKHSQAKSITRVINKLAKKHSPLISTTDTTPTFTSSISTPLMTVDTAISTPQIRTSFNVFLADKGLPRKLFSCQYLLPHNYHTETHTYHRIIHDTKQRLSNTEPYATLQRHNVKYDFYTVVTYQPKNPGDVPYGEAATITVPYNSAHLCALLPPPYTHTDTNPHSHNIDMCLTFRLCTYPESRTDSSTQMSDLFIQNPILDLIQTHVTQWHYLQSLDQSRGKIITPTHTRPVQHPLQGPDLVTSRRPPPLLPLPPFARLGPRPPPPQY